MAASVKIESTVLYSQYLMSQSNVKKLNSNQIEEMKRSELESLSNTISTKLEEISKTRTASTTPEVRKQEDAAVEVLIHKYIDTARLSISPTKSLESNIKVGKLNLKTASALHKWQEKFMVLNISLKRLFICKDNEKHIENDIDLSLFSVKWLGNQKGSKYCLEIVQTKMNSAPSNSIKDFIFSSSHEIVARDWFNNLVMLMETPIDNPLKKSETQLIGDKRVSRLGNNENDLHEDLNSLKRTGTTDPRPSLLAETSLSIVDHGLTQKDNNNNIWINKDDLQKMRDNMISSIKIPQVKELAKATEDRRASLTEESGSKKDLSSLITTSNNNNNKPLSPREEKIAEPLVESQKKIDSMDDIDLKTGKNNSGAKANALFESQIIPIEKASKDSGISSSGVKDPVKVEEEVKESVIPLKKTELDEDKFQDFSKQLTENTSASSYENIHVNKKCNSGDDPDLEGVPVIFHTLLKEIISTEHYCEDNYGLVYVNGPLRILQNNKNPDEFRVFLTLKFPAEGVFSTLLDVNNTRLWNRYVTKIKTLNKVKKIYKY
jgi:hypothetical protein